MLVDLEDGEDESQHVFDEVFQQGPVAVVHLNQSMGRRLWLAIREIKEVEIQTGIRAEHVRALIDVLVDPLLFGERRERVDRLERVGWLESAEGRYRRIPSSGHVVHVHLPFRLHVHFIGERWERLVEGVSVVGRRKHMRLIRVKRVVQWRLREVVSQGELRIHGGGACSRGVVGICGGGGQRVRQARRGTGAGGTDLGGLLRQLGVLDACFDHLLLLLPLLVVTPPHRPFVFALQPEIFARSAQPFPFVALLSSQATCKATCTRSRQLPPSRSTSFPY